MKVLTWDQTMMLTRDLIAQPSSVASTNATITTVVARTLVNGTSISAPSASVQWGKY